MSFHDGRVPPPAESAYNSRATASAVCQIRLSGVVGISPASRPNPMERHSAVRNRHPDRLPAPARAHQIPGRGLRSMPEPVVLPNPTRLPMQAAISDRHPCSTEASPGFSARRLLPFLAARLVDGCDHFEGVVALLSAHKRLLSSTASPKSVNWRSNGVSGIAIGSLGSRS